MSYKLCAVDLDGTLLDPNGAAHDKDLRALKALMSEGLHVTIVTGRLYSGTRPTAEALGIRGPVACVDGSHIVWDLIRTAWQSTAALDLAPMQDFLGLGNEARMNYPSRLGGNWEWRMAEDALSPALGERIKELNWLYLR